MRSILKLTLANIRNGKGAFKSIIVLMMLLTFSFSGTVSNDDRLSEARTERFSEAGMPDLLVSVYDDFLTEDMIGDVRKNPYVKDVELKPSLYFVNAPKVDNEELEIRLTVIPYEDNLRVFDDDGCHFLEDNSLSNGEIYLPYKLKLVDGFHKNATITLQTQNGYDETFTVKGYYEDIFYGATTTGHNCCVITRQDHARLLTKTDHIDSEQRHLLLSQNLYINGTGELSQTELCKELSRKTPLISTANTARTREMQTASIEMYSNIGTRVVAIFVLLLLTMILITMHNNIRASVEMDQAELGILKSQGFTALQISLVYVLQYTLALIIGAVLGILVSIPACRYLISMWKNLTGILSDTSVSYVKCALMGGVIILICTLFIFISTSKIRRISPVCAIRGAKGEVYFDSRLNTRIRKKPLAFFLALRQLNTRRKSYLGTAFIVTLLTFFIVSIMILVQGLNVDQLFTDISGEISINDTNGFRLSDVEEVETAVQTIDSGAALLTESYHRMLVDGEHFAVHAYRAPEDVYKPMKGRVPKYDNEIMLTESVSKQIGKEIGDTVTLSYQGNESEFVVTGYFQSIWEFGLVTIVTPDGMQRAGYNEVETAYVSVSDTSKQQAIIDLLNTRYENKMKAEAYIENSTILTYKKVVNILMYSMSSAIYAVLLTFAAVIVTMVCKRTFIRERTDLGIFKATGFTVGALRMQFALRFTLIALVGSAFGCTAGILWSRKLITYVLQIVGLSDFTTEYTPAMFILPAMILCLCFFLTAWIASRRIGTVNVRELVTE